VQALFFAFFLFTSVRFDVAINKVPTARAASPSIPWKKHLNVLYAASTLIMVRSVFRIVEFIMGNDGYILKHEVFLYLFDGLLMLSVMAVFNVVHPSEVQVLLKGGKSIRGMKMVQPAAVARWQADEAATGGV
jgi:RTA1 like protein